MVLDEERVICPHCEELVPSGIVCDRCGKDIEVPAPTVPVADEPVASGKTPGKMGIPILKDKIPRDEGEQGKFPVDEPPETSEVPQRSRDSGVTLQERRTGQVQSECPHIRLLYNEARIFLKDSRSTFNFRIEPKKNGEQECHNLKIAVRFAFQEPVAKRAPALRKSGPTDINIDFKPQEAGLDISADVILSYRHEERECRYYASILWDGYPPSENPSKVIENLEIKLENVNSTMAADQKIRILDNLRAHRNNSKLEDLTSLKLDPVWTELGLIEYDDPDRPLPSPPDPPHKAKVERLTLLWRGKRIHLVGKLMAQLGRNRDCTIVTRLFDKDGTAKKERNRQISGFHAQIKLEPERCVLVDGGERKDADGNMCFRRSTCGTFINGRRIMQGGAYTLTLNHKVTIGLAGENPNNQLNVFGLSAEPWVCDPLEKSQCRLFPEPCDPMLPACLVARRADSIPEMYILLWKCCPLRLVDPALQNMRIWRQANAFAFHTPDIRSWLVPGQTIDTGGEVIKVETWNQWGL